MKINKPLKFRSYRKKLRFVERQTIINFLIFNFQFLLSPTNYNLPRFIYKFIYRSHRIFCRQFFDIFNLHDRFEGWFRDDLEIWKKKSILIQGRWQTEDWLGDNDRGEWSITYDLHAEINRASRGWDSSRSGRWSTSDLGPNGIGHRDSRDTGILILIPATFSRYLWQHIDRKRHRESLSFPLRLVAISAECIFKQTREDKESLIILVSNRIEREREKIFRFQEYSVMAQKLSHYYYYKLINISFIVNQSNF